MASCVDPSNKTRIQCNQWFPKYIVFVVNRAFMAMNWLSPAELLSHVERCVEQGEVRNALIACRDSARAIAFDEGQDAAIQQLADWNASEIEELQGTEDDLDRKRIVIKTLQIARAIKEFSESGAPSQVRRESELCTTADSQTRRMLPIREVNIKVGLSAGVIVAIAISVFATIYLSQPTPVDTGTGTDSNVAEQGKILTGDSVSDEAGAVDNVNPASDDKEMLESLKSLSQLQNAKSTFAFQLTLYCENPNSGGLELTTESAVEQAERFTKQIDVIMKEFNSDSHDRLVMHGFITYDEIMANLTRQREILSLVVSTKLAQTESIDWTAISTEYFELHSRLRKAILDYSQFVSGFWPSDRREQWIASSRNRFPATHQHRLVQLHLG